MPRMKAITHSSEAKRKFSTKKYGSVFCLLKYYSFMQHFNYVDDTVITAITHDTQRRLSGDNYELRKRRCLPITIGNNVFDVTWSANPCAAHRDFEDGRGWARRQKTLISRRMVSRYSRITTMLPSRQRSIMRRTSSPTAPK